MDPNQQKDRRRTTAPAEQAAGIPPSGDRRRGPGAVADPRKPRLLRGASRQELFRRFRKPLVGIGLLGAAAPLTSAAVRSESGAPVEPAGDAERDQASLEGHDTEEALASRIGELRASSERSTKITDAISKYGISRELAEDIYDTARDEGVDADVAYGLVKTESDFREDAVSHAGARGLTQLMPRTARWLLPGTSSSDLHDRRINLSLGFRYLDELIGKYRGDVELALTAYNRGPGTVDRVLKTGGNPDNGYAAKVLRG